MPPITKSSKQDSINAAIFAHMSLGANPKGVITSKLKALGEETQQEQPLPHLMIKAYAGSGKTSTLVEGLRLLVEGSTTFDPSPQQEEIWAELLKSQDYAKTFCMTSFGSEIVKTLEERIPKHPSCSAKTLHKIGNKAIFDSYGPLGEPDQYRSGKILAKLKGLSYEALLHQHKELADNVSELVSYCKLNALTSERIGKSGMEHLIDLYELDIELDLEIELGVVKVLEESCKTVDSIDFNDMIWLPVVNNLILPKFDMLFVDECQDLNICQQKLSLKLGKRIICCGDPHQCQPEGTLVRVTGKDTPVPIETLKVGDQLVTFNPNSSNFNGKQTQGRKVEKVACREYEGDIYCINGSHSTPNHRWLTRFRPDVPSNMTALYLAELEDGTYRIGITQLVLGEGRGGFGPGMRARQRLAKKVWVLRVFDNREKAREAEFKNSMVYRIPQLACYEGREDQWCKDLIDDGSVSDIENCLADYGKLYGYPIWEKSDTQHIGKYSYVTQACNLIPKVNQVCIWREGVPSWELLEMEIEPNWEGKVYSLQVQPTEKGKRLYISDNVVTHNSIYAFAGADANSYNRLHETLGNAIGPGVVQLPLSVSFRCSQDVIRESKDWVPGIEPHAKNPKGLVQECTEERLDIWVRDGDLVICRNNAALVSKCLQFLGQGKKAYIRGRKNIARGLVRLVARIDKDWKCQGMIGPFTEALLTWGKMEMSKADHNNDEKQVRYIGDRVACIKLIAEQSSSVEGLKTKLNSIFEDKTKTGIQLSTIHQAKGIESERVFFIMTKGNECPAPWAKTEIQKVQEKNLRYIGITRAIEDLIYVH